MGTYSAVVWQRGISVGKVLDLIACVTIWVISLTFLTVMGYGVYEIPALGAVAGGIALVYWSLHRLENKEDKNNG